MLNTLLVQFLLIKRKKLVHELLLPGQQRLSSLGEGDDEVLAGGMGLSWRPHVLHGHRGQTKDCDTQFIQLGLGDRSRSAPLLLPPAATEPEKGKQDGLCFLLVSEGSVHIFPILVAFGYLIPDWPGLGAP